MQGFTSIAGIRYYNGIKTSDFIGKRNRCKHGLLNSQPCSLCLNTRKVFSKPFPGEHYDYESKETTYTTESFDIAQKALTHERNLFAHWEYGEGFEGQAKHIDSMRPLDRLIIESSVCGHTQVNRINHAVESDGSVGHTEIEDRRNRFDRLQGVAEILQGDYALADQLLQSFRTLELNESVRRTLTYKVKADHSHLADVTLAAMETSKEIIPPYPVDIADECLEDDDDELEAVEKPFANSFDAMADSNYYATPIGHAEGSDYMTSKHRTKAFTDCMKAIKKAKDERNGVALAFFGKDKYISHLPCKGREVGVLWFLYHTAKDRIAHDLRYKFEAAMRYVEGQPRKVYGEIKGCRQENKSLGKVGAPRFTSDQWKMLVDAALAKQSGSMQAQPPIECYESEAF